MYKLHYSKGWLNDNERQGDDRVSISDIQMEGHDKQVKASAVSSMYILQCRRILCANIQVCLITQNTHNPHAVWL